MNLRDIIVDFKRINFIYNYQILINVVMINISLLAKE